MNASGAAGVASRLEMYRNGVPIVQTHEAPAPTRRVMWRLLLAFLWAALPSFRVSREVNRWRIANLPLLLRGYPRLLIGSAFRVPMFTGFLRLKVFRADGAILDYGPACALLVTTAGVNKLVSGLNATDAATFQAFKYHGFGTGATAPAIGDTALVTELTTQYSPDNTRPTGSQTTGGSSNVYRTVGTVTPDASAAVTEMGLFSAASAGTLLDRFTFTSVSLNGTGDSLQTTIDITLAAGG